MGRVREYIACFVLLAFVVNAMAAAVASDETSVGISIVTEAASLQIFASGVLEDEHERLHHAGEFCDHTCHSSVHVLGIVAHTEMALAADLVVVGFDPTHQSNARHQPDTQFRPPRLYFLV